MPRGSGIRRRFERLKPKPPPRARGVDPPPEPEPRALELLRRWRRARIYNRSDLAAAALAELQELARRPRHERRAEWFEGK